MFAVLQPIERPSGGPLARIRAWRKPRVQIEERRTGDIGYCILWARCKNGAPNWNKVYRAAGREAGRLLLPEGFWPPPGCGIGAFDGSAYRRKLLCNAFFRCLASGDARRLTVTFIDWDARYCETALRILERASAVHVVTDRPERYEYYAERAQQELGAYLMLTGDTACMESATAVLAPEGLTGVRPRTASHGIRPINPIYFSGEKDCPYGMTVDGRCIRLPEPYESLLPRGIDRLDFAAALYDSGRPASLGRLLPGYIRKGGNPIPLRTAAALLAAAVR